MARARRSFSPEFREKAVAYVIEQDKAIAAAARELGIGKSTLADWMAQASEKGSASTLKMSAEERDEIKQLKAENRELKMRVELLKKATAFVCPERGVMVM